jgi:hypothetical protein
MIGQNESGTDKQIMLAVIKSRIQVQDASMTLKNSRVANVHVLHWDGEDGLDGHYEHECPGSEACAVARRVRSSMVASGDDRAERIRY